MNMNIYILIYVLTFKFTITVYIIFTVNWLFSLQYFHCNIIIHNIFIFLTLIYALISSIISFALFLNTIRLRLSFKFCLITFRIGNCRFFSIPHISYFFLLITLKWRAHSIKSSIIYSISLYYSLLFGYILFCNWYVIFY